MAFERILFVYDIESGLGGGLVDWSRRTFSPREHPCALRRLTHGAFGTRGSWSSYVRKLDTPARQLARDAFRHRYAKAIAQQFPDGIGAPVIVGEGAGRKLTVLASPEEIERCKTIEDLKDLVTERLLNA